MLWDQTPRLLSLPPNVTPSPVLFNYGRELTSATINAAIQGNEKNGVIDEKKVYDVLDYHIHEVASHGTHVMDIAAGNGKSLIGSEGVANEADIVFVQLPTDLIEYSGPQLFDKILDGVLYISALAKQQKKPAVVNISYGSYAGPHDGTSQWEKAIDNLLKIDDRAVVVAAGNGFEADCHAFGIIQPHQNSPSLRWIILPEDPTANTVDIWYGGSARLELWLTPPGATTAMGPVKLGDNVQIHRIGTSEIIGWAFHSKDLGNNDNHIVVSLNKTVIEQPAAASSAQGVAPAPNAQVNPISVPAPAGTWKIELRNVGQLMTRFDAWIERDAGHPGGARRRQSHFAPGDAYPGGTLSNLASGNLLISVGGYNAATQEVCRYSACGPTRPTGGQPVRRKPDVCAPAEGDVAGRGILSASSLSADPTRMNGTSAAAPHVAGLIALMFQYGLKKYGPKHTLNVDAIRDYITQGAQNAAQASAPLKPNRHQKVDVTRAHKQEDVWTDLTGAGKVNVAGTMNLL